MQNDHPFDLELVLDRELSDGEHYEWSIVSQNSRILKVIIGEIEIPLREPLPIDDFEKIITWIHAFAMAFDVNAAKMSVVLQKPKRKGYEPWEEDDLAEFIRNRLNAQEWRVLEIVAGCDEIVFTDLTDQFRERFPDVSNNVVRSVVSSLTRQSRKQGHDSPLFIRTASVKIGEKRKSQQVYRITQNRYAKVIRTVLAQLKEVIDDV